MNRKRSWSKRSKNRAGFKFSEQSFFGIVRYPRYLFSVGLYDLGFTVLWAIMYTSMILVACLLFSYWWLGTHSPYSDLTEIADILIYVTLPSLLIGNLLCWIGKRLSAKRLLPVRCQRCPECFYDLSARPRDDDTCPECGMIAPRRECVRLWCKLLRSRF